ncbi:MAG: hypothetical protein U0R79_05850 [Propionicimonas sp.]
MKSRTSSSPVLVVQRVTSTNVPRRTLRVALALLGRRDQPATVLRGPQQGAEGGRGSPGRHSQSMLPSRPTSAPVRQSLTSA